MGYLYENSNPERFQHLCQSLVIDDFPALQCLPVGQRDGGRDGWDPESRTVLQVKFRRNDEDESADWLIKALEGELEKVQELARRGAERYIIATNARGTAQLDAGRIDKVQKWLDEFMPIPSTCFWRDELDRRFDTAGPGLKLKYSEMLSLEDGIELVLDSVLDSALGPERIRQKNAIRSFIKTQFDADKTVKFKQVELSNQLLGLFVDIPVLLSNPGFKARDRARAQDAESGHFRKFLRSMMSSHRALVEEGPDGEFLLFESRDRGSSGSGLYTQTVGMAEILLSGAAQDHLKLVVIEGAPGQGKSTLAQYVCQMHRARYLKKDDVLESVPPAHGRAAFRVPIKVDLRDYARFLGGSSPFSEAPVAAGEVRSLEAFLAQLITFNSGGISFNANDVVTLLQNAPALLFLDGLDEVADYSVREKLVNSVGEALSRWGEFDTDIQVVVTSRPSVFGRAPSFEHLGFVTLTLGNLDDSRIEQYAGNWILARNLDRVEGAEVKKILSEKLEAPHIRHLTRNPMQLTILLNLIHQRGHSLPDQRTDLYRRYVDLFLTREADKSIQVRNNRDLLLGFIQHLAWILQSQAETSKGAGSITAADLQTLAKEYLVQGGHPVEIADNLFAGGLERIFVLVERIQGLYEFEVQPLREYFCAQHLYELAPVGTYLDAHNSATGKLGGDRAQRFEALARNPFWLNVCRFYAGSCMRGETGTLVFSLQEMIASEDVAVSMHARRVGLALLQDWVFSSVKYAQAELIRAILDVTGVRLLFSSEGRAIDECRLAADCGSDVARDMLFEYIQSSSDDLRGPYVCIALRRNDGSQLYGRFGEWLIGAAGANRTKILSWMFRSGAVEGCGAGDVWGLIVADDPSRTELVQRCSALLEEQPEIAVRSPELVETYFAGVLDGLAPHTSAAVPLGMLATVLSGAPDSGRAGFRRSVYHWFDVPGFSSAAPNASDNTPGSVRQFLEGSFGVRFGSNVMAEWPQSANDWRKVIEHGRELFGDRWSMMSLALRSAGLVVQGETSTSAKSLFDPSLPLGLRVRAARLRRGGTDWWLEQLDSASNQTERMLWAGTVLMWASVPNLYGLADEVNRLVDSLSEEQFQALTKSIEYTRQMPKIRADRKKTAIVDVTPFSPRCALLVALAFPSEASLRYTERQVKSGPLGPYLEKVEVLADIGDSPSWRDSDAALEWARSITRARRAGVIGLTSAELYMSDARMTVDTASELVRSAADFPTRIVSRALVEMQRRYRPKALTAVATDEGWTF